MFGMFNKKEISEQVTTVRKKIADSRFYTLELYEDFENKERTYIIINKEYLVVEAQTEMLPQALAHLEELDTALGAAYDSHDADKYKVIKLH